MDDNNGGNSYVIGAGTTDSKGEKNFNCKGAEEKNRRELCNNEGSGDGHGGALSILEGGAKKIQFRQPKLKRERVPKYLKTTKRSQIDTAKGTQNICAKQTS